MIWKLLDVLLWLPVVTVAIVMFIGWLDRP
jgi:hypothetical protein